MSVRDADAQAKQKWLSQCARLTPRERELVAIVLASLGMGAEMADYAFTGQDLLDLARMIKQEVE